MSIETTIRWFSRNTRYSGSKNCRPRTPLPLHLLVSYFQLCFAYNKPSKTPRLIARTSLCGQIQKRGIYRTRPSSIACFQYRLAVLTELPTISANLPCVAGLLSSRSLHNAALMLSKILVRFFTCGGVCGFILLSSHAIAVHCWQKKPYLVSSHYNCKRVQNLQQQQYPSLQSPSSLSAPSEPKP